LWLLDPYVHQEININQQSPSQEVPLALTSTIRSWERWGIIYHLQAAHAPLIVCPLLSTDQAQTVRSRGMEQGARRSLLKRCGREADGNLGAKNGGGKCHLVCLEFKASCQKIRQSRLSVMLRFTYALHEFLRITTLRSFIVEFRYVHSLTYLLASPKQNER
jgi:hypothetical protein